LYNEHMSKRSIMGKALLHALGGSVYVALVALLMSHGDEIFGKADNALSAVAFLLLFVVSAAVMGIIVFGKPLMWYLDGEKKNAVTLALSTVGWLFVITILTLVSLISL